VAVCGEFNWPDYCKNATTTTRTITVINACSAPVELGSSAALPGRSRTLRPGENATFKLPIVADESLVWSGRVYTVEQPASYAELTLLSDNADRYIARNGGSERVAIRPDRQPRRTGMYSQVPPEYWCGNARGQSTLSVCRADHAAANDLGYTVTFCAP
jgi:hypothetical protein